MKLFPPSWEICAADTVCSEIVDCLNKTAPVVEHDTGFRMIRTTNVRHGRVDVEDNRFVEEAVFNKWTRRARPKRNDVILSREAPLGEVGLLRSDAKVFLGQRTMLYRGDPKKLDQYYLYYQMVGPYVQAVIQGKGQGSTVAHLRVPDAETLPIPVAPLPVQRTIAAIMAAYDDLIEANRRRIALLERMAEELYREWFVRLRFPGYEKTKMTKGLPARWERKRVEGLTSYLKRGVAPIYDEMASGIAINQKCIRDGKVDLGEARHQSREVAAERYIKRGDILVNSTGEGTLGRVAQVQFSMENCIVDSHVTIVRPAPGVPRHFLGLTLQAWAPHFATMGRGSTNQTELAPSVIGRVEVMMPADELTKRFEAIAEPLAAQAQILAQQNVHLQRTRDLLLPRLISGKLPVESLDIAFPPSMAESKPA